MTVKGCVTTSLLTLVSACWAMRASLLTRCRSWPERLLEKKSSDCARMWLKSFVRISTSSFKLTHAMQ